MSFRVVIPARYHSTRLPAKALVDIAGKPMIQHVHERALKSGAESVVIATDDERIRDAAETFGATVCMTSTSHRNGTDRIAEVAETLAFNDDDIIVNVQGDTPLIHPSLIRQVAENLHDHTAADMSTLCSPINNTDDLFCPDVVKVVRDKDGYALYFSRATIAWDRDGFSQDERKCSAEHPALHHIGLYAYRVGFLKTYVTWPACAIETLECLEQLRVLWHGKKIHVDIACQPIMFEVNSEEDLIKLREYLKK